MSNTEFRVRWTPDGIVLDHWVNGASGTYGSIGAALDGLRIHLEAQERAYEFPGMTDRQAEAEMLARGIERALGQWP